MQSYHTLKRNSSAFLRAKRNRRQQSIFFASLSRQGIVRVSSNLGRLRGSPIAPGDSLLCVVDRPGLWALRVDKSTMEGPRKKAKTCCIGADDDGTAPSAAGRQIAELQAELERVSTRGCCMGTDSWRDRIFHQRRQRYK